MAKNAVVNVPSDYSLSDQAKELISQINNSFAQSYLFWHDVLLTD